MPIGATVWFKSTYNSSQHNNYWRQIGMDTTTQQIIIITLGIIAIISTIMGNQTILDIIVAGLIGFLGQKTMTDKQNETLTKQLIGDEEEDGQ